MSIVYDNVRSFIEFTKDKYWKDILNDISLAKCPSGLYIQDNKLYVIGKKKDVYIDLEKLGKGEEAFANLHEFITRNTTLYSEADKEIKDIQIQSYRVSFENIHKWSNIKKKNVKEQLLHHFVIKMKWRHKLTTESANNLLRLINLSLAYKIQTKEDIHLMDGEIQNITDIEYCPIEGKFVNRRKISSASNQEEVDVHSKKRILYYCGKDGCSLP